MDGFNFEAQQKMDSSHPSVLWALTQAGRMA